MRDSLAIFVGCTALIACTPDTAHTPISLTPPYNALPPAPLGTSIEPGRPISLNGPQQEAVVMGVTKWMKDPGSVQFEAIVATRTVAAGSQCAAW